MRYKPRTYVGVSAGNYPWIPTDHYVPSQYYSFLIKQTGTGDVSYQVQYTLDNVFDSTVTPIAVTADDAAAGTAAVLVTAVAEFHAAMAAIRLRVISVSGVAGAVFEIRQGGPQ